MRKPLAFKPVSPSSPKTKSADVQAEIANAVFSNSIKHPPKIHAASDWSKYENVVAAVQDVMNKTGKTPPQLKATDFIAHGHGSAVSHFNHRLYNLLVAAKMAFSPAELEDAALAFELPKSDSPTAFPWQVGVASTFAGIKSMLLQRSAVLWLCRESGHAPRELVISDFRSHDMNWLLELDPYKKDHYALLAATGFAYSYTQIRKMAKSGPLPRGDGALLYPWQLEWIPKSVKFEEHLILAALQWTAEGLNKTSRQLDVPDCEKLKPFFRMFAIKVPDALEEYKPAA